MKNKNQKKINGQEHHDAEIQKAVAQAWYGHSTTPKTSTSEFDARQRFFKGRPSRFRIEAMSRIANGKDQSCRWDFGQSLWDAYEIVSVSRKLEMGLVMADTSRLSGTNEVDNVGKRRKESKNSLRNLFNRMSSRRFSEPDELPSGRDNYTGIP